MSPTYLSTDTVMYHDRYYYPGKGSIDFWDGLALITIIGDQNYLGGYVSHFFRGLFNPGKDLLGGGWH